jgi:ribosomal protein S12 methylthiotransferase
MQNNSRNVAFVTLGCAKNEVDSDRMRALIEADPQLAIVEDADDADVIIVNTCSFLMSAVEEGIELTLSLVEEKLESGIKCPVVMAGCIPSRYGDEIECEMPDVAAFVPCDREDEICSVLHGVLGIEGHADNAPAVARTVQAAFAYVKISDGCDRFCSFCAIPYIRGRYFSRPEDVIISEVKMLLEGGVREIVLIGQDTGIWGSDLPGAPTLAHLLRQVAQVVRPYNGWVRVLYLQPEGLSDELVSTIRDTPEVVKYIDIPLQHSNAQVLKNMNRTGDTQEFLQMVARLRREVPGITLRTTALVGFPGETEEQFDELVDFIEKAEFDYCSVFAYSQEDGTEAAGMDCQLDEEVKHEREQKMVDIAEAYGFASAAKRVGQVVKVLVDSHEEDQEGELDILGRAYFQAPDSDGVVHLGDADVAMGDIVDVMIDESVCYELFGHVVA